MKNTIYLISLIMLLFSCSTEPQEEIPLSESNKEIWTYYSHSYTVNQTQCSGCSYSAEYVSSLVDRELKFEFFLEDKVRIHDSENEIDEHWCYRSNQALLIREYPVTEADLIPYYYHKVDHLDDEKVKLTFYEFKGPQYEAPALIVESVYLKE